MDVIHGLSRMKNHLYTSRGRTRETVEVLKGLEMLFVASLVLLKLHNHGTTHDLRTARELLWKNKSILSRFEEQLRRRKGGIKEMGVPYASPPSPITTYDLLQRKVLLRQLLRSTHTPNPYAQLLVHLVPLVRRAQLLLEVEDDLEWRTAYTPHRGRDIDRHQRVEQHHVHETSHLIDRGQGVREAMCEGETRQATA